MLRQAGFQGLKIDAFFVKPLSTLLHPQLLFGISHRVFVSEQQAQSSQPMGSKRNGKLGRFGQILHKIVLRVEELTQLIHNYYDCAHIYTYK
jgi:hypothetical protein